MITKRPPDVAFRPERVFISPPNDGGASDWAINEIHVVNIFVHVTRWERLRMRLCRAWRRVTWWWPRKPLERRQIPPG